MTGCGAGAGSSVALPQSTIVSTHASQTFRESLSTKKKLASSEYASAIIANGPQAYYQLDDPTSTLVDSSSNGLNGTYGPDVTRGVPTITNGVSAAASFPGGPSYDPKGYAHTPISALLQTPQVTIEAWIKLSGSNTTSHDLPIVAYGTAARGFRYGLFLHGLVAGNNALMYYQHNAGKAQLSLLGGTRMVVGPIYHVVATFDGNTVTTYVNGNKEASATYPGSIDYSGQISDGLQIGGADQIPAYASASFPGTIAQVAVYGSALNASQIANHFLAGQYVPVISEPATSADAFVDSIGVNAHFENSGSAYATQYPQVKAALVALGVRHLREAMSFNEPWFINNMKDLAASGIRASYITQGNLTQSQVQSFPGLVGSSFEQFEGVNEPDLDNNPNWVADTRTSQQNLYTWVKSDPQIANYPVLGPALTSMNACIALGNISQYEDAGNIHDYFGVFNPGTGGWGGIYLPYGVYGSIAYNVNLGRIESGSKPIVATETGYGTIAGSPLSLDYRTHLRYMTRLFFEQFNGGVARTYSYELLDQGGSATFNNFGLLQSNLQPKPAYTGIKSIISALSDPGPVFTPAPLSYQLTGFTNNVHHTLLQKRNGTYIVAIWLEVPDWVTVKNAGGDITVPSQTVTLTTTKQFAQASISSMDENGNFSTVPLSWTAQSGTFSVTDKVSLITLTP
jgi:hypothetical protein